MSAKRWDGAAYQDIATRKRWDGASWIDLTVAKRWDGVAWQDVTFAGGGGGEPLSVIAAPGFVSNFELDLEPAPSFKTLTSTQAVTVTPSGGAGSPTYAWTRVSGDSAIFPLSPTSATTFFRVTIGKNTFKTAVWRCTVTDGPETAHVDITASFSYETGL